MNNNKAVEMRADISAKLDTLKRMRSLCSEEKRLPTTNEQTTMKILMSDVERDQEKLERAAEREANPPEASSGRPLDIPCDLRDDSSDRGARVTRKYEYRSHTQKKDFSELFGIGKNDYRWNDQEANFFQAITSGRFHPELTQRAMNEGTPSDGGFLVPVEYSKDIHNVALESEIVMPRCQVQPMISNEINLPAMSIGDHSSNLFGGFTASWTAEAGALTDANPSVRQMTLSTNKLVGFLRMSNELMADMSNGAKLKEICGKGLGWYRDKAFITGSGVGQPLGILNSGCAIEVAKESGQSADTIVLDNLTKMLSRLYLGGFKNAVWLVSQTALPQLLTLSLSIGTGGSASLVMTEDGAGNYRIYGRPVIFSEHMSEVGDAGDICLVDLSQYVAGVKEEMRIDTSGHVYFATDEAAMRLVTRIDGQCLWDEALTMSGTGTTVSPVVTLAERA